MSASSFITGQIPAAAPSTPLTPTNHILALQVGNCYGLLCMIALCVFYTTEEPKVARNFLIACAIADIGHVYACYVGMGYETFMDIGHWSAVAWGNVGITTALFLARVLYFAGLLGEDRITNVEKKTL